MTREEIRNQLKEKPVKLAKFDKFCSPKKRKFGKSVHPCKICGKTRGVVRKYGLNYCRQCFREVAEKLGFKKYQ